MRPCLLIPLYICRAARGRIGFPRGLIRPNWRPQNARRKRQRNNAGFATCRQEGRRTRGTSSWYMAIRKKLPRNSKPPEKASLVCAPPTNGAHLSRGAPAASSGYRQQLAATAKQLPAQLGATANSQRLPLRICLGACILAWFCVCLALSPLGPGRSFTIESRRRP